MDLLPCFYEVYVVLFRKFDKLGLAAEMKKTDLRDFVNLTDVANPRVDGWLSKYLVKKTDNKLLLYPIKPTTEATGNKDLAEEKVKEDVSNNLKEEQKAKQINAKKRKTIAEKQRYVKLLENILEHRLKKRLKGIATTNLKTGLQSKIKM